jgi:hypothetical protein
MMGAVRSSGVRTRAIIDLSGIAGESNPTGSHALRGEPVRGRKPKKSMPAGFKRKKEFYATTRCRIEKKYDNLMHNFVEQLKQNCRFSAPGYTAAWVWVGRIDGYYVVLDGKIGLEFSASSEGVEVRKFDLKTVCENFGDLFHGFERPEIFRVCKSKEELQRCIDELTSEEN